MTRIARSDYGEHNSKYEARFNGRSYVSRLKRKAPAPRGANGWCKEPMCYGLLDETTGICPVCGVVAPVITPMEVDKVEVWRRYPTAEMPQVKGKEQA